MTFRKTRRSIETLARMKAGKDAARMDRAAHDYPVALPELRREIIIIDHDFGEKIHRMMLYRTNRRDCYRVVADGVEWKKRVGWSKILAGLRKSMPRVGAQ